MRSWLLLVVVAACGGPQQPVLANAPRPDPAAVAGVAAAAATALTLVDPDAATRKPEKKQDIEMAPVEVNENVPEGVLDRLDSTDRASHKAVGSSSGAAVARPTREHA